MKTLCNLNRYTREIRFNIRKIVKFNAAGQQEKRDPKKSRVRNKNTGPTKST